MTFLGMAVAALRRRRLRTILTILSMAIATGVFTATLSVQSVLESMLDEAKSNPRVAIASANAGATLPLAYVEQIKKMPSVRYVYYGRIIGGDDGKRFRFPVIAPMAHSEDYVTKENWRADTEESVKKAYEDKHWLRPTPSLLEKMGWKIGDRITVHTTAGNITGTIYGTCYGFACTQPLLFMDYDTLDQLLPADARSRISYAQAGTTVADMQKLISTIDDTYANSPDPTLTTRSDEFTRTNFMRQVGSVPVLLEKVNLFLLIVTAIVMMSTLVVSLRERRSQFGTLRAIGYSRKRVFALIVVESLLICVIGGLVGAAVPFLLFHTDGIQLGGWALANVLVTKSVVLLALGAAAALGLLIGLVPALFATRVDILKSLEGT